MGSDTFSKVVTTFPKVDPFYAEAIGYKQMASGARAAIAV